MQNDDESADVFLTLSLRSFLQQSKFLPLEPVITRIARILPCPIVLLYPQAARFGPDNFARTTVPSIAVASNAACKP